MELACFLFAQILDPTPAELAQINDALFAHVFIKLLQLSIIDYYIAIILGKTCLLSRILKCPSHLLY